jgi:enoyl-CoA hydratase/carnithine racemase
VKALLLRAGGEAFCLGRQGGPASHASALEIRAGLAEPILGLYADVRATPVPVIAVVQGAAKGFGCALVGQCDLAIGADVARFSLPEMDHNIPPTLAISALVGRLSPKRLAHLVYTRFEFAAAQALEIGLVSEVEPLAELDAAVGRLLKRIVDRDRAALCAVKEYMLAAAHLDASSAARLAANLISGVLSSARSE